MPRDGFLDSSFDNFKTSFKERHGVSSTSSEVEGFIHAYPEWHNTPK
jgi:hypothetical protein